MLFFSVCNNTHPPHFSPNAMRADFNLSRPKEASSCVKEWQKNASAEAWTSKLSINIKDQIFKYERLMFHLPRRKGRKVQMSSSMCQSTTCLFLMSKEPG